MNSGEDESYQLLQQDFVDQCHSVVEDLEDRLNQVYAGQMGEAEAIQLIRREAHNLKGQGTVFGFSVIAMIAHRLEDYLAKTNSLGGENIDAVNVYLDHIGKLADVNRVLDQTEAARLLRSLPQASDLSQGQVSLETGAVEEVEVMVSISSRLHLHRLAQELNRPGWRMISFGSTLELLENALVSPPDGVIVSGEMPKVSGIDLGRIFQVLDRVRDIPFVLLTSRKKDSAHFAGLPERTEFISTGTSFSQDVLRVSKCFSAAAKNTEASQIPKQKRSLGNERGVEKTAVKQAGLSREPRKGDGEEQPEKSRNLKILVAEDNKINRMLIQSFFEKLPFDLMFAENGVEAVECCRREKFDVVLMDVIMPEMDGMEATGKIRALENNEAGKVPIIALTADDTEEDRLRYKEAGMNGCIGKPIDPMTLIEMINSLVARPCP
ncbi:response regulator [Kiloniella laminariae]|uniref:Response regulator n=1 Tax=Kiloniella laminariae TaxID=454162 RepID=A0ABT4LE49_9PROT|nr:response regulator [Kiloniella laminariae]MCZ4279367.1 response regulator [Kiloniella laminariae]